MTAQRPAYPSEEADKYIVRFPPGMRDQLKESARANNRTMNAEIVARLEQSFAATSASSGDTLTQAVQELQSLQRLGTLNYRLERATYKAGLVRERMAAAWSVLQGALKRGSKEDQEELQADFDELSRELNHYRSNVEAIEAQIADIHRERKVTGLKELRDVEPVYASVRSGPFQDTGLVTHKPPVDSPPSPPVRLRKK